MKGFVYILQSSKTGKYYLGSTSDLSRRLADHNYGNTSSTKSGIPWILLFSQEFESIDIAMRVERRLKRFKSKLILDKIIESRRIELKIIRAPR